jgi:hypothetical protein
MKSRFRFKDVLNCSQGELGKEGDCFGWLKSEICVIYIVYIAIDELRVLAALEARITVTSFAGVSQ